MIESIRSARLLFELRRGAHRTPEALHDLQGALLRSTVAHANTQVPFYRRLWKSVGADCEQVRSIDDLRRLPIISSDQVRAAAESGELMAGSSNTSNTPRFSTSGSSGRPLLVPRGDVEARLWRVGGLRMQLEHGFRWSDTTVQFDPAPGPPHPLQSLGIARTVWIPHELTLEQQLARLTAARAQVVLGNVSVLRRIARAVTERNVALSTPKMVFSTAEVLDDDSRTTIATAFGVAPFDVYAMTETGFMSWQCETRASLHINSDLVFVEILRGDVPAVPGELGRVVVSTLRARTMPLLRYDTGDLATAAAGPCTCGRTFPTMGPIEGRARHAIQAADGRTLTQRAVMNRLAGTLRMGEYRVRRKSERAFLLETTPRAFAAGVGATDAQRVLGELLGDVEIAIETIDALPGGLKTHAVVDDRVS